MRTAPLCCAPIFIGTALVATWVYQQRSAAEAYVLWALVAAAWLIVSVSGISSARSSTNEEPDGATAE